MPQCTAASLELTAPQGMTRILAPCGSVFIELSGPQGSLKMTANSGSMMLESDPQGRGRIECDFTSGEIENYRISSLDHYRVTEEQIFRAYQGANP